MKEWPRMLYRAGVGTFVDGVECAAMVVADARAQTAAEADGWMASVHGAAPSEPAIAPADDAPATRAELEAKAKELGLKFDGRWGDKRLSDAIAAKLA
jgi:hypothetical protein